MATRRPFRTNAVALLLALSLIAPETHATVTGTEVLYVGGTLPNLRPGAMGELDTRHPEALLFLSGEQQAALPYARIQNVEYSRKLARRIGVVLTIAVVAVLKRRQRKHFLTIDFKDEQGTPQVAVFEVSKQQAPILLAILRGRSPRATQNALPPQRLLRR